MKKTLLLMVVISSLAWMSGCASSRSLDGFNGGGSGGGTSGTFQAGNWAFVTSGGKNGQLTLGGFIGSSGNAVNGHLFVVGDSGTGFPIGIGVVSMPVSGTVAANGSLTLTGVVSSSSFTITFPSATDTSTLTGGTYSVTGGTDTGDSGSITGAIAGSVTGTWAGTDTSTGGTMTVNMVQAANPNTNGSFTLTAGSSGVTFTGSSGCVVTGNLNPVNDSFVAGGIVVLDIQTVDQGVNGNLLFAGGTNNAASPTSIVNGGFYTYTGGSSCLLQNTNQQIAFALTKQ
jgi:hypothetical protein